MKKGLVIATGVVILAGVAVVVGTKVFKPDKKDVELTLATDSSSGVCMPSNPQTLRVKKNDTVSWTITNTCAADQVVSFRDFRSFFGGTNNGIITPYPPTSKSIKNGQKDKVEATIVEGASLLPKFFKYDIWVGPTAATQEKRLDPDVEIWP